MNTRSAFATPLTAALALAAAAALVLPGCGTKRQVGICADPVAATEKGDADALIAAGDAAWEQRRERPKLEEAVAKWAQALRIDPKRGEVRVRLARARYFLADGYYRADEDKEAEMVAMFDLGVKDAEIAIGQQSPAYREGVCANKPFTEVVAKADKASVPAMYWYASNLGKWGLAKGIFTILKYKDNIKAMMDRIMALDPTYFYHAPDRYFGAYYTKVPFPAGDMVKSREHFQKSIDGSPQYLATKVLMAENYCTKVKDRALFKKLLDEVVAFDLAQAPEIAAENAIEQEKARNLLEDIDTFFGETAE
jgi:tetratricopeptide (TPR) repeat protein